MRLGPICAAGLLLATLAGGCQRAPAGHDAPLGVATPRDRALKGQIYLLAAGTGRLPDFRTLKPAGALYVRSLDIPDQAPRSVFPDGVGPDQPFAVDYHGAFQARTAGDYRFRLLSAGGSRLLIDRRLVIDLDGAHPALAAESAVRLGAGDHHLELQYVHDARERVALQLGCQAPGGRMTPFPGCGLVLASTSLWRVWLLWVAVLAGLGASVIWQTRRRIVRESRGLR